MANPNPSPETRFKSGAEWNGNPGGRPRSIPIEARWRELLEATEIDGQPIKDGKQVADLLARQTLSDALRGDHKARKEILERVYGKVPLRIAGHDGGPVEVNVTTAREQLRDRIEGIADRLNRNG